MKNSKTRVMVEGALMIALAVILGNLKLFEMPQGGSVTLALVPMILMGLRHGVKWGAFTGFVYGVLDMFMGFKNVLYCNTLIAQIGCILLDYVLACMVLGLGGLVANRCANRVAGVACGAVFCGVLRFLCSFFSGWLLWGSYAWDGWNPALYSLVYNGTFMLPDTLLAVIVMVLLCKAAPKVFEKQA